MKKYLIFIIITISILFSSCRYSANNVSFSLTDIYYDEYDSSISFKVSSVKIDSIMNPYIKLYDGDSKFIKMIDVDKDNLNIISDISYGSTYNIKLYGSYDYQIKEFDSVKIEAITEGYENAVLKDKTLMYTGDIISLEVTNIHNDITVTYSNNQNVLPGEHTIKASLYKDSVLVKELSATLTILKYSYSKTIPSVSKTYDNSDIVLDIEKEAPGIYNVTYVDSNNNTITMPKDVGTYKAYIRPKDSNISSDTLFETSITITKANPKLDIYYSQVLYDGSIKDLILPESFNALDYQITYNTNERVNVGRYYANISVSETKNYYGLNRLIAFDIVNTKENSDYYYIDLYKSELAYNDSNLDLFAKAYDKSGNSIAYSIKYPSSIDINELNSIDLKINDDFIFNLTVKVLDKTAPTIEIIDTTSILYEIGDAMPDYASFFYIEDDFDQNVTITYDSELDMDSSGIYPIIVTTYDNMNNTATKTITIYIGDNSIVLEEYRSIDESKAISTGIIPSTGNLNLLVIPVWITDGFSNSMNKTTMLSNIDKAFNGDSTTTGFESVSSYYYKSSFGKLKLNYTVTDFVTLSKTTVAYENMGSAMSDEIYKEALTSIDSSYNFNSYDNDSDNYIDGVFIIYNKNFISGSNYWWAYTTSVNTETKFDGINASLYAFASYKFITDGAMNIDSHTYIHETGHMLGLEDYYDYDTDVSTYDGLFGADMMDYTVGDHNSLSKLLLGWISPKTISNSGKIKINNTFSSGDAIIVSKAKMNDIYGEFFIIELYTNSGLNAYDTPIGSSLSFGLRVLHCDTTLNLNSSGVPVQKQNISYPSSYFKYNNTDGENKLLAMLPAKTCKYGSLTGDCLFSKNSTGFYDKYSSYTLHDGSKLFFDIEIITISKDNVSLFINFDI